MNITINNKEYKVKYTIRALFNYELITGKCEIKTLLDNTIFFYAMILANNPDDILEWDDFVDALDNDANLLAQLQKVVEDYHNKSKLFDDGSVVDSQKKS